LHTCSAPLSVPIQPHLRSRRARNLCTANWAAKSETVLCRNLCQGRAHLAVFAHILCVPVEERLISTEHARKHTFSLQESFARTPRRRSRSDKHILHVGKGKLLCDGCNVAHELACVVDIISAPAQQVHDPILSKARRHRFVRPPFRAPISSLSKVVKFCRYAPLMMRCARKKDFASPSLKTTRGSAQLAAQCPRNSFTSLPLRLSLPSRQEALKCSAPQLHSQGVLLLAVPPLRSLPPLFRCFAMRRIEAWRHKDGPSTCAIKSLLSLALLTPADTGGQSPRCSPRLARLSS